MLLKNFSFYLILFHPSIHTLMERNSFFCAKTVSCIGCVGFSNRHEKSRPVALPPVKCQVHFKYRSSTCGSEPKKWPVSELRCGDDNVTGPYSGLFAVVCYSPATWSIASWGGWVLAQPVMFLIFSLVNWWHCHSGKPQLSSSCLAA